MKCLSQNVGSCLSLALCCILMVSNVNGLRRLGYVERKEFYAEMLPLRTWIEARQYCYDSGMSAVTITSKRQAEFLNAVHNYADFNGWFWTSGRELQLFIWDNIGHDTQYVSYPGMVFDPPNSSIQNCLAFSPTSFLRCNECNKKLGTLCEKYFSSEDFNN